MMKIMLDSGAYSAWTLGNSIDIDDYISFIKRKTAHLECYVNLDVIAGAVIQPALNQAASDEIPLYRSRRDNSSAALQMASKPAAFGAADSATASEMLWGRRSASCGLATSGGR